MAYYQWVYECRYYLEGDEQAKQKVRHLRQNLNRAANRENAHATLITLDEIYEIGERQNWRDPFSGDLLEFTRGGNYGMRNINGTGACNPMSCSIDRIDNNLPYTKTNVRLVTSLTNMSKGNLPDEDYINQSRKVAKMRR
jgi:hypothetical protein